MDWHAPVVACLPALNGIAAIAAVVDDIDDIRQTAPIAGRIALEFVMAIWRK
jgi:hypothetical protein